MVTNDKVVTIVYRAANESGEVVESNEGFEPLEYLHGYENILPGFEKVLTGMQLQEERTVQLEPEEAYGAYSDDLVFNIPIAELGDRAAGLHRGDIIESAEGKEFEVMNISAGKITLNGNPRLAGTRLQFTVKVLAIRNATAQELQDRAVGKGIQNECGPQCCC